MSDWQPIATAPKNPAGAFWGEIILIWNDAAQLPYAAYWGQGASGEGEWLDADGTGAPHGAEDVTHWMPLPEPPK